MIATRSGGVIALAFGNVLLIPVEITGLHFAQVVSAGGPLPLSIIHVIALPIVVLGLVTFLPNPVG